MKVIKFIRDPKVWESVSAQDYQGLQAFTVNNAKEAEEQIRLLEKAEIMQNGGMLILDAQAVNESRVQDMLRLITRAQKKSLQIKTVINEEDKQQGAVLNLLRNSGVLLSIDQVKGIYKS